MSRAALLCRGRQRELAGGSASSLAGPRPSWTPPHPPSLTPSLTHVVVGSEEAGGAAAVVALLLALAAAVASVLGGGFGGHREGQGHKGQGGYSATQLPAHVGEAPAGGGGRGEGARERRGKKVSAPSPGGRQGASGQHPRRVRKAPRGGTSSDCALPSQRSMMLPTTTDPRHDLAGTLPSSRWHSQACKVPSAKAAQGGALANVPTWGASGHFWPSGAGASGCSERLGG